MHEKYARNSNSIGLIKVSCILKCTVAVSEFVEW